MKKYNILVTGIGAIIGYGIANSLKQSKYDIRIIGMDIYNDAYGSNICDEFIQSIPAADKNYSQFIKNIIAEKGIDLVLFGTEQEIYKLIDERDILGNDFNKLVLNNKEIIDLSRDKWLTYKFLEKHNIEAIPTKIEGEYNELKKLLGNPFMIKPRKSYASKGIVKIENEEDFIYYRNKVKDQFMVQKIVGNIEHEYTVSTFGYGDGRCIDPIVIKRKLSQEGATAKAEIIKDDMLAENVKNLVRLLKPIGPTNFQYRLHNGKVLLLETNPRISSATSIRTAFGYNEAEMCIEFFLENKLPSNREIKYGTAIRYIADWVNIK